MNIKIIPITNDLIKSSAEIREIDGLLTNDSFVLSVMKDLGIQNILTNDDDFDHIKWLNIYKPDDLLI